MNGTKEITDGNVRKDFPGGFPNDERNCFTPEGRTTVENGMYNWLRNLLHWRQGNEVISKGKQIQFIPYNGIYVVARQYAGKTVLTILNGKRTEATMQLARYSEVIGCADKAKNIINGEEVDLGDTLILRPRQTMILEF